MLKDKIIIVTGGAGLLGKVFIKTIVLHGGTGIIADMNEATSIMVKQKIQEEMKTTNVDYVILNITSKRSIDEMIQKVEKKYGKIDALVNNAYPRNENYGKMLEDVSFDDFVENVGMHLGGYFITAQRLAIFFKKQGYGNIVNMSSIYGVMAPRFEVYENTSMTMPIEYAAIKSAIIQLTKYMAKYFKGYNIRINAISPGGIHDRQPTSFLSRYNAFSLNKGMLDTDDLTGTLLYLLSDMSTYVNGQNIIVDDGYSL